MRTSCSSALTLIELLVTIVIIAVLMGLLLSAVTAVRERANRTAASQVIIELHTALENYRAEDFRHAYPPADPLPSPFIRRDPRFVPLADPALRSKGPRPTVLLDLLTDCGFTWRMDQVGSAESATPNCLLDPWNLPFRYQVDDGKSAGPALKPAAQADWNPGDERPFAYVWSLGRNASPDAASASNWLYRRDGKVH